MARRPVQLRVLHAHLTSQNAAVVQGCVPLVQINGPSYRMRDHQARLDQLRRADNVAT